MMVPAVLRPAIVPGRGLLEAGSIANLLLRVVRELTRAPYLSWWRATAVETWAIIIRCAPPLMLSLFALGFGTFGVQAGTLLESIGQADRLGGVYAVGMTREPGAWVTGMILAGVAGTSMCADLGARRIREEIDALLVLGVEPIRALVVPRVVGLTLAAPVVAVFGVLAGYGSGLVASLALYPGSSTTASVLATFESSLYLVDILSMLLRVMVFGCITALVCCHKGMNVSGGPAGVGRAVNQSVVVCFVAIWVVNYAFQSVVLASFTDLQVVR